MDDFAWLGLPLEYHRPGDLWSILFQPRAQGTVRTLSERLFFLAFTSWFGFKAIWFHYWVLITQCGNLLFANAIVRRLSGSALAGVAAATAWAISPATAIALSWLSAYNEILCAFFMLAAFYCLIRFSEHGEHRFWIYQWIAYLAGFLALEATVAYPAVAGAYVWLAARQYWKKALWLWVPSIAFAIAHAFLIPKNPSPIYKMTLDLGMLWNLWRFTFKAVGPSDLANFTDHPYAVLGWWLAVVMLLVLTLFLAVRIAKRDWMPVMGVVWFVCFLGPVLPLQNHFTDYYVTIGSFGLAMLTGWVFQSSFYAGWALRIVAAATAALLIVTEVAQVELMEQWYRTRSGQMRLVFQGVDELSKRRHIETLMLAGIDNETFISGLLDDPFRLIGIKTVYLVPGSEKLIRTVPLPRLLPLRVEPDKARKLLENDNTVVASFDGKTMTDVTPIYRAMTSGGARLTMLKTNDGMWASRLGPGWYEEENGFRWMQRQATVELDTPAITKGARVVVNLFCPPTLLAPVDGKLQLSASVDGKPVGVRSIVEGQQDLVFDIIPAELLSKPRVEIALEVSHVVVPPGDGRELGAAVFSIGLKTP